MMFFPKVELITVAFLAALELQQCALAQHSALVAFATYTSSARKQVDSHPSTSSFYKHNRFARAFSLTNKNSLREIHSNSHNDQWSNLDTGDHSINRSQIFKASFTLPTTTTREAQSATILHPVLQNGGLLIPRIKPPTTIQPRKPATKTTIAPSPSGDVLDTRLVDITWLKPHEEIVSQERVTNLLQATLEWNAYKLPLLVDAVSGAILDGHHRYAVGCEMGLSKLPVILVDYLKDESIKVDVWPGCGQDTITKEEVIAMSLSDEVYPPKTSKHCFVETIAAETEINIPLKNLF